MFESETYLYFIVFPIYLLACFGLFQMNISKHIFKESKLRKFVAAWGIAIVFIGSTLEMTHGNSDPWGSAIIGGIFAAIFSLALQNE